MALNVKGGGVPIPDPMERADPLEKATVTPGAADL